MAFLSVRHLPGIEVRQHRRDGVAPVAAARRTPARRERGEEPAHRHRRADRVQAGTRRDLGRCPRLVRRGVEPCAADDLEREPLNVFFKQLARSDEAVVEERQQLVGKHLGEALAPSATAGEREHRTHSYARMPASMTRV